MRMFLVDVWLYFLWSFRAQALPSSSVSLLPVSDFWKGKRVKTWPLASFALSMSTLLLLSLLVTISLMVTHKCPEGLGNDGPE